MQDQLSMLERWNRDAADVEVRFEVEPEHRTPSRHRAFISRAFSKFLDFDFKPVSWKDSSLSVWQPVSVPSSRDTLDWAIQQDTPTLTVDNVEGRASGRMHWTLHRTRHEVQVWKSGGNS